MVGMKCAVVIEFNGLWELNRQRGRYMDWPSLPNGDIGIWEEQLVEHKGWILRHWARLSGRVYIFKKSRVSTQCGPFQCSICFKYPLNLFVLTGRSSLTSSTSPVLCRCSAQLWLLRHTSAASRLSVERFWEKLPHWARLTEANFCRLCHNIRLLQGHVRFIIWTPRKFSVTHVLKLKLEFLWSHVMFEFVSFF